MILSRRGNPPEVFCGEAVWIASLVNRRLQLRAWVKAQCIGESSLRASNDFIEARQSI